MEQEKQTPLPLEDIPLQDFIPTPTVAFPTPHDCVSPETAAAQLEKYKVKMGTSIEIALKYFLPNDKWQLIPPPPPPRGGGGGAPPRGGGNEGGKGAEIRTGRPSSVTT
jgi:hypothetical protein